MIELCEQYVRQHEELVARNAATDEIDQKTPEYDAAWEANAAEGAKLVPILNEIKAMPATTIEGLKAKACAFDVNSFGGEDDDPALGWSIAKDLLTVGTGPAPAENPDAKLIAACAAYPAAVDAVNYGKALEEDGPEWRESDRLTEVINNWVPDTLAGMVAKARAIKKEACQRPEICPYEDFDSSNAGKWAMDVIDGLLALYGDESDAEREQARLALIPEYEAKEAEREPIVYKERELPTEWPLDFCHINSGEVRAIRWYLGLSPDKQAAFIGYQDGLEKAAEVLSGIRELSPEGQEAALEDFWQRAARLKEQFSQRAA